MRIFTDQMNRTLRVEYPPRRIVSLVPSQTELLYDLGLREEVIGITKFCVHPQEWFHQKTHIGGTKQLKIKIIEQLYPDLIIGNKEENEQTQIESLMEHYSVWMSDVHTLEDALQMIESVGALIEKNEQAKQLVKDIKDKFIQWQNERPALYLRVAYFIWRKPYMIAAANTFINSLLQLAGFENIFVSQSRYPEISLDDLAKAAPQVILLSSEPYPFKEKHFAEIKRVCPTAVIKLVDGELFSWYGSRLLYAPDYFKQLHKELNS